MSYPDIAVKTREQQGIRYIFDPLRRSWLKLTNEEWVRQHFVAFLTRQLHYPAAFIAQEKKIQLGDLVKRFDILVYNRLHQPWMMVECKAMEVPLTEAVLQQVLRYNIAVPVSYLVITNGSTAMVFHRFNGRLEKLTAFPPHE